MVRLILVGPIGWVGALALAASIHAPGRGRAGRPDGAARSKFASVADLYRAYGQEPCGRPSSFDGVTVHVRARLDWGNVFDKTSSPQLPYEKFRIHDEEDRTSVDVWTVARNNQPIFELIRRHANSAQHDVFVTGTLATFDMPVRGDCRKGLKIELHDTRDIHFE